MVEDIASMHHLNAVHAKAVVHLLITDGNIGCDRTLLSVDAYTFEAQCARPLREVQTMLVTSRLK